MRALVEAHSCCPRQRELVALAAPEVFVGAKTLLLGDFAAVGGDALRAPVADAQMPTQAAVLANNVRRWGVSAFPVQMPYPIE